MKRAFYGGFSLCLLLILAVVIRYPRNNLIPSRMFFYMLIWVLILCGAGIIFSAVERLLYRKGLQADRISRVALACYVILYGVALYVISLALRSRPITDYQSVYETAYGLASGQVVEDWSYFSMWTNNLGALTILTACMKVGMALGFADPYYFVLALNVLQVMAVIVSIFYLTGRTATFGLRDCGEEPIPDRGQDRAKVSTQWLSVFIFTLWMPVWACTNSFYTDQLSFGGSIIAAALLSWGISLRGKKKGIVIVGAGIVWGVGIAAKSTAGIWGVALIIAMLLAGQIRCRWKELLSFYVSAALAVTLFSAIAVGYPSKAEEHRLRAPVEYWLAMGLMGNGSYADNAYLVENCYRLPNVEERTEFCRRVIADNWTNLFDIKHLSDKTSVIFGQGDIAPTSHFYAYEENLLWQWVCEDGTYYWKYACLSTGFFYAILLLMLVGTLFRVLRPKREDIGVFVSYLTVFGIFLFLMLWEAQNKQLYNHIPWMTLAAVYGLETAKEYIGMAIEKIKENKHGRE
ncbi:MAG: hypothetical protein NC398_06860 [Acetatifactor muris]|nr:hypothetical protein [Acetatifactor muris]MCM1525656.1 hypothetical protein [Bacteroides sp.]